ncbi:copia protein [Tanacetum coccineum]
MLHYGLHYTHINVPQAHMAVKEKYYDPGIFRLWHDRLGHPGSTMMKRIIENTHGHPLKDQKFPKIDKVPLCISCSLRKLIARSSPLKVKNESPMFLERIQSDICDPIHPPYGPFRYFMVLIDASSKWSHLSLLSTRNVAFAKFLAQIIKLRAHFPDYTVKRVRLDNAGEFTSHAFNDYCMSVGIVVQHLIAHIHTQNGLAESLIKRLQLIARPLIMRTKLPISMWGHAILHAASLIRIRPSANHKYSRIQLAFSQEPNISHLRIFGCAVYVPITPSQRTKIARFTDCHFDEPVFPELGGVKKNQEKDVTWCEPSLLYLDPRTKQCEAKVQKIVHLQEIVNQLPDAFTYTKRVTKSHILAANAPTRVEITNKQAGYNIAQESQKHLKCGRPIGSKDKNPLYVPIAPPQRTKMGPQRKLGIYVGYETSSIIRYIEPLTCDLFTSCFVDCHFDEAIFLKLGAVKKNQEKDVTWCEPLLLYLDPRTKQCETEVQKIVHLQEIANQLPNAFTYTKRVTKSHIPAANSPARVEIPNKQAGDNIAQESQKHLKRGRPVGSKDKNPRKRKGTEKNFGHDENVLDETQDIETSLEEEMNDINKEMSINYSQTHILWDRNEIVDIGEIFSYSVASNVMSGDDDPEPKSVFGPIVTTPRDVKPVGYRWIFVRKRNEKNEVTSNRGVRPHDKTNGLLGGSAMWPNTPEEPPLPPVLRKMPDETVTEYPIEEAQLMTFQPNIITGSLHMHSLGGETRLWLRLDDEDGMFGVESIWG